MEGMEPGRKSFSSLCVSGSQPALCRPWMFSLNPSNVSIQSKKYSLFLCFTCYLCTRIWWWNEVNVASTVGTKHSLSQDEVLWTRLPTSCFWCWIWVPISYLQFLKLLRVLMLSCSGHVPAYSAVTPWTTSNTSGRMLLLWWVLNWCT